RRASVLREPRRRIARPRPELRLADPRPRSRGRWRSLAAASPVRVLRARAARLGAQAMSNHPCVVTIDHRSKPRVLFSGTKLVEVDLPVGTRVVYPKPPMKGLPDVKAAIRYAIAHPENSEPLFTKLEPGMKVTIAIDDISLPLPPMQSPDVRQQVLEVVLPLLADYGVTDIHIIVATCLHRPMTADEIKHA